MLSCSAQRKSVYCDCGIVTYTLKKFDSRIGDYAVDETFWQQPGIWYRDSLDIEEIKSLTIEEDSLGKEARSVGLLHFTFIDIPARSLYDYTSFSDTARLIKAYTHPDSLPVPGGWTFYIPAKDYPGFDPPVAIGDTSIDGVSYKRRRIGYTNPSLPEQEKQELIAYFRCDKKIPMQFSLLKSFSHKIGCSCVRIDHLPASPGLIPLSQQIEYVADRLTAEEMKVFDAWEQYAKKHPVK